MLLAEWSGFEATHKAEPSWRPDIRAERSDLDNEGKAYVHLLTAKWENKTAKGNESPL
jgi:hypothetical protein